MTERQEPYRTGREKKQKNPPKETPSTIKQLATALAALDAYAGTNSEAEHRAEAKRLGGEGHYRRLMVNALSGVAQTEAMLADGEGASDQQMQSEHHQVLKAAGVKDDPWQLLRFMQWQALRVGGPLREFAQNEEVGPVVLAAAHTANALQLLIGVCAEGQKPEHASPPDLTTNLEAAREALSDALKNVEIMFDLFAKAKELFSEK